MPKGFRVRYSRVGCVDRQTRAPAFSTGFHPISWTVIPRFRGVSTSFRGRVTIHFLDIDSVIINKDGDANKAPVECNGTWAKPQQAYTKVETNANCVVPAGTKFVQANVRARATIKCRPEDHAVCGSPDYEVGGWGQVVVNRFKLERLSN